MTKSNKIVINYIYGLTYQVLSIIIPLITTPYISRVLGAGGVGTYGYVQSICTYFVLFGTLGSALYGQREVAYVRDNSEYRNEVFWNIELFRILTGFLGITVYILIFCARPGFAQSVYIIMLLYLIANVLDISWFFQGLEEFRLTVLKNIIIKIAGTILIFILVKSQEDVWIYALCIAGTTFLANLSLWMYLPRYIGRGKISIRKIKGMMIPLFSLFIPQAAVEFYTVIDKTMLGSLTHNMSQVGCYEQTQKIIRLATMLIASLGNVMLPNISNDFANCRSELISKKIEKSLKYTIILTIAISTGIIGISDNFVEWFYGDDFSQVKLLLKIMAVLVVALGISNVLGMQFLMPTKRQKYYTLSVLAGCTTNIFLNVILIPEYMALGAATATIFAEFVVTLTQVVMTRKSLDTAHWICQMIKYVFGGILVLVSLHLVEKFSAGGGFKLTFAQILTGAGVYSVYVAIVNFETVKSQVVNVKQKYLSNRFVRK